MTSINRFGKVEVDLIDSKGLHRAIVPSGASTGLDLQHPTIRSQLADTVTIGQHEAHELRDGARTSLSSQVLQRVRGKR